MVIQCPGCGKKYNLNPEKIPEKGAKLTCQGCGHNFAIRKKKDPAATPAKTPPCQICGAPSTRVLKADPPLILCENCFEREKEKSRRMLSPTQPGSELELDKMAPGSEYTGISSGAGEEKPASQMPLSSEVEFPSDSEFVVEPGKSPEPKAEPAETQYFDSFAEIPDLEGYQSKSAEAPEPKADKSEADLMKGFQQFKKIEEEPAFDETGFEAPPEPKPTPREEKAPLKAAPPPPPPKPREPEESGLDDFVFSPKEVERMEDPGKIKPDYLREKIETGPPVISEKKEAELEREIFGEMAEDKRAEGSGKVAPAFRKSWTARLPRIPAKTAVLIGAVLLALAAGYFVFSSDALRSSFSKLGTKPEPGKPLEAKVLSEEDQRILNEHLALAQELYRMDTNKNYLQALGEIRTALKIDKTSQSANALNMLVAAFLAQRSPGFISRSRAKSQIKKADPELMQEPDFQAGRALLSLAEQSYPGARVMAEKLIEQHPDYALGYWILAQIHLTGAVKKFDQAEPLLLKATELDPGLVQARASLAELNFQKAQYPPALEQFQEVLKLSPEHSQAGARVKEIQNLIAQTKKPEEKPGAGMLLVQPTPGTQPGTTEAPTALIPITPEPAAAAPGATAAVQPPKADFHQELNNYLLNIISETRQPLSRTRVSAPTPTPGTPTTPTRPPEEAPSQPLPTRPPEEAP